MTPFALMRQVLIGTFIGFFLATLGTHLLKLDHHVTVEHNLFQTVPSWVPTCDKLSYSILHTEKEGFRFTCERNLQRGAIWTEEAVSIGPGICWILPGEYKEPSLHACSWGQIYSR